jgi:GT2 family glycosyltransferase
MVLVCSNLYGQKIAASDSCSKLYLLMSMIFYHKNHMKTEQLFGQNLSYLVRNTPYTFLGMELANLLPLFGLTTIESW